jgi:hypothetical protein
VLVGPDAASRSGAVDVLAVCADVVDSAVEVGACTWEEQETVSSTVGSGPELWRSLLGPRCACCPVIRRRTGRPTRGVKKNNNNKITQKKRGNMNQQQQQRHAKEERKSECKSGTTTPRTTFDGGGISKHDCVCLIGEPTMMQDVSNRRSIDTTWGETRGYQILTIL